MKVVIRVIALPPVLLKGNYEGGNWAIAYSECFANALPPVLLKGKFEGGNWAISHG
jgi:hypothetical protein